MLSFRRIVDRVAHERWARFWTVLGGVAGTIGLVVTVVALTATRGGSMQPDAAGTTASPRRSQEQATTTSPNNPDSPLLTGPSVGASPLSASPSLSDPPVLLNQQVDLDKYTGADVDNGHVRYPLKQGAAGVDLYLDWGYILYSSVVNSDMYDDTSQGGETGAYGRCANYRQLGQRTFEHEYIGSGMQFCITTSDGYPGWVQINSESTEKPGGAILKVVVWKK